MYLYSCWLCKLSPYPASFPGCLQPGNFPEFKLFTDVASRQLHTSFKAVKPRHVILLIFPPADYRPFLLVGACNCLLQVLRQKTSKRAKVIVQSAYTIAIERSTIAMNGRDSDVSTHDAIRFTVGTFSNLIGSANSLAAEVTI